MSTLSSFVYFWLFLVFIFFTSSPTTEIYTLSLHDALPICSSARPRRGTASRPRANGRSGSHEPRRDRKSTRLNSSHQIISYAVFCVKKKKAVIHEAEARINGETRDTAFVASAEGIHAHKMP